MHGTSYETILAVLEREPDGPGVGLRIEPERNQEQRFSLRLRVLSAPPPDKTAARPPVVERVVTLLSCLTADELERVHQVIVRRLIALISAEHLAAMRPMADDPELGVWSPEEDCLPAHARATARPPHSARPIRILITDDMGVIRKALASFLEGVPEFEVVGEAEHGAAAVELAAQLRPDVVLMDVAMPRMNGIEATQRITTCCPQVRVIGLSMLDRDATTPLMLQAGAVGHVPKGADAEALVAAIRAACGGDPLP